MNANDADRPPIVVEVLLLSAAEKALRYRKVRKALPAHEEPDTVAWRACRPRRDNPFLLHSTSWRYDRGRVVLTYVALPDPRPASRTLPIPTDIAEAWNSVRPSPRPSSDQVAAHACRHLAFLARTDDAVAGALGRHSHLRRLILQHVPDVAGQRPVNGDAS